ncbi:sporulation protein [Streptomyces sp. NPDC058171]
MAVSRFLKMMANGLNPPEVTTELDRTRVRPGERMTARVMVEGGAAEVVLQQLTVELVVRFETDGEHEVRYLRPVTVHTFEGPRTLAAGAKFEKEAVFELPWEMPLTHTGGRALTGAYSAVRTALTIDDAVDRGDLDVVEVHALPEQAAVLKAMTVIGFRLQDTEVKLGVSKGSRQTSGWWQEIELKFPSWYRGNDDLELHLVTRDGEIDVRPGSYAEQLTVTFDSTRDDAALAARLDAHLRAQFGG